MICSENRTNTREIKPEHPMTKTSDLLKSRFNDTKSFFSKWKLMMGSMKVVMAAMNTHKGNWDNR